jgi:hypothetical protein
MPFGRGCSPPKYYNLQLVPLKVKPPFFQDLSEMKDYVKGQKEEKERPVIACITASECNYLLQEREWYR